MRHHLSNPLTMIFKNTFLPPLRGAVTMQLGLIRQSMDMMGTCHE